MRSLSSGLGIGGDGISEPSTRKLATDCEFPAVHPRSTPEDAMGTRCRQWRDSQRYPRTVQEEYGRR